MMRTNWKVSSWLLDCVEADLEARYIIPGDTILSFFIMRNYTRLFRKKS